MGIVTTLQVIKPCLVEAYEEQSASAVSCVAIVRSVAGFGFPLFAPQMYSALGYGRGNSVLGFFGLCVGVPAPILHWYFGAKLRMKTISTKKRDEYYDRWAVVEIQNLQTAALLRSCFRF